MALNKSFLPILLLASLLAISFFPSSSLASFANPITNLPGYNGPNLTMYSGYVTVDEAHNRNIFFWFIESENNPSTDPLVAWYQGGPGCSGLGGLFSETGPLRPTGDGGITYTNLGWTKLANMLFLEQPAGVGFSYSDDPNDYNTNDTRAAEDNYAFLLGFLELFPEYVGRDLWLTGESYGGIYVPTLAAQIVNGPSQSLKDQFRGFMIGNPVIGCQGVNFEDVQLNLFYWHGLVSYTNYHNYTEYGCHKTPSQEACRQIFRRVMKEIGAIVQELKHEDQEKLELALPQKSDKFPSLDPDDLYQDFCTGNGTLEFSLEFPGQCQEESGHVLTRYLNTPDVQKAIFANPAKWTECTNNINYTSTVFSTLPYYESFFQLSQPLDILIYSGDVDIATVPFATSLPCLNQLNRSISSSWQPWFVNGATAGYVEVYDTYTYATIKGAGHEAPQYQPWTSYNLFERFLLYQNLSTSDQVAKGKRRAALPLLKQRDLLKFYGINN